MVAVHGVAASERGRRVAPGRPLVTTGDPGTRHLSALVEPKLDWSVLSPWRCAGQRGDSVSIHNV